MHRTIQKKICRCIHPVCLEVLSIYRFNLQVTENKFLRKVFEEKWSQHFRTLHRVKIRDTRRSCGIVMIRESRRGCWTVHLDNMGEPKESTEFWWWNVLENVNFGYAGGTWRIRRRNLVMVFEFDNNIVILGYRGNLLLKQEEKWRDRSVKFKKKREDMTEVIKHSKVFFPAVHT
jgi:hypothetical protein